MVLRAYMMIIRGGCRPAWAAAAVDAGYARRALAACAVRAVSPGGQARAGGRTDVKLLIGVSGGFSESLFVPYVPVDHLPPLGGDTHRATARLRPTTTCHEDAPVLQEARTSG